MVGAHNEGMTLEVGAPMADEPDELALVRGDLEMTSGEWLAEEGKRTSALMKDGAEARARGVAVHHELLAEVGQVEDWSRG